MNDMSIAMRDASETDWSAGAAYIKGRFVPLGEAAIPVTDWGYRRSDVTYDVVSVWNGAFFRLDDHLRRFQASMKSLRLAPPESEEDMRRILTRMRPASRQARGLRGDGLPAWHAEARRAAATPRTAPIIFVAFAMPWVWVIPEAIQARGAHVVIAETPRIPEVCVDPRVKNFHWGDLTRGQFEASDPARTTHPPRPRRTGDRRSGLQRFHGHRWHGRLARSRRARGHHAHVRLRAVRGHGHAGPRSAPITADEMRNADEVFLATTAGGIMPASRIDGRIMGNDRPGPISARLARSILDAAGGGLARDADRRPSAGIGNLIGWVERQQGECSDDVASTIATAASAALRRVRAAAFDGALARPR